MAGGGNVKSSILDIAFDMPMGHPTMDVEQAVKL